MTSVIASNAGLNMISLALDWVNVGRQEVATSESWTLNSYGEVNAFAGAGFRFDPTHPLSSGAPSLADGVVTGWSQSGPGGPLFEISGFAIPAATISSWIASYPDYAFNQVAFAGNDKITGGAGADVLRGEAGNDTIVGGAGFDDINGNSGNDVASGGAGSDWVVGGQGDDILEGDEPPWDYAGGGGADIVLGNLGDDECDGGEGDDLVRGGQGDDQLYGGSGNDWLSGDRGSDTITGGVGADTFHSFGEAGLDRVLDFNRAEGDRVLLDSGTNYAVVQSGADTVISITGGAQMVLVGVPLSSLTEGWIYVA